MYNFIRFKNRDDIIVEFNAAPDPDGFFSTESLVHEIMPRSQRRGKSEAHGSWPTFTYYEAMTITLEGHVIANTVEAFNNFIKESMTALMPNPLTRQTDRVQGTFIIQKTGFNTKWEIPVSIDTPLQVAVSGQTYANQAFHLSFMAFRPYYYEPATNQYFWHP